jgi:hypothetical protein
MIGREGKETRRKGDKEKRSKIEPAPHLLLFF